MSPKKTVLPLFFLAASILFFPRPLPAVESGEGSEGMQKGKIETCVYLKAEGFVWKEFEGGSRLLEESGPRYGLGIFRHYNRNGLTFRPMVEVYGGTVDYNGQTQGGFPIVTETNYLGGNAGFDAGGVITLTPAFYLEPFVGFGVEYWERDIESSGVGIGYRERWESYSARGGLRGEAGSSSGGVRVFGEAALKWPFANANRADLPVIGKVKVRPEGELGWNTEAGIKAGPVRIAFFYEMVKFSKSDEIVVPIGGGLALLFWQPDSKYYVYGLTAGWLF
jgi:hypothetical protein